MKTTQQLIVTGVLTCSLMMAGHVFADNTLGGDTLTRMGAERAGNGDEIPDYEGGLTTPPSNYQGDMRYVNPFPEDEELFRIDQSNVDEYKDRLSPGQVAMINQYDDFFLPIYQTRRTAALPEEWLEITAENATTVELEQSGNGILNYTTGTPFPIPEAGQEVIFNHTTRYRGGSVRRNIAQMAPQTDGQFSTVRLAEDITYPTFLSDYREGDHDNILFYFRQTTTSPSRLSGNVLLVHETIDQVKEGRSAWIYNSGQRRVRRAPNVAYDGPGTAADGQRTADNLDLFNGAPDKYDWEIIGKKEMYIPYNAYDLNSTDLSYSDIVGPGHIDQSLTRYELHRVWHVRATLKEGERHIYGQRDFYVDEDSWQIAVVDHYDGRGELWRMAEAHMFQAYDFDIPFYAFETLYDMLSGRYLLIGLTNEETDPYNFATERRASFYTPAALRRSGR
ncbi:MAG: DUF1329 domain-containing protein [Halomonadaceae bacterium]|nr:MAG: DUF1329 domain-containing protein [Halomonadaceae bacterium]